MPYVPVHKHTPQVRCYFVTADLVAHTLDRVSAPAYQHAICYGALHNADRRLQGIHSICIREAESNIGFPAKEVYRLDCT